MNILNEIWIGMLGLHPLKNNSYIEQNEGAYTNILIMASSINDYLEKAKKYVKWLDFEIFDYEDIEPLRIRLQNYVIDDELTGLSDIIKKSGEPQISTLHVFDREDL